MIYSHALHHLPVDSLRGHTRLVLSMHSEIMLNLLTQMKHTKDHLIKIVLLQMPGLVEQATVAERMEEECSLQLIRSNATTLFSTLMGAEAITDEFDDYKKYPLSAKCR